MRGRSKLRPAGIWMLRLVLAMRQRAGKQGPSIWKGPGTAGGDVTDVECWSQQWDLFMP